MKKEIKNVHTEEQLAAHVATLKELDETKEALKLVESTIQSMEDTLEKLGDLASSGLTEENQAGLQHYYDLKMSAINGRRIQLLYKINELERKVIDFEALAYLAN